MRAASMRDINPLFLQVSVTISSLRALMSLAFAQMYIIVPQQLKALGSQPR